MNTYTCNVTPKSRSSFTVNNGEIISWPSSSYVKTFHASSSPDVFNILDGEVFRLSICFNVAENEKEYIDIFINKKTRRKFLEKLTDMTIA